MDEVVIRAEEAFFRHELFLIELLARAEAGIDDFDILIGFEAAEADEVAGEGVNLHGRAHIQDEDLPASGIGAGQHDEGHGLGDRHEIADDVRVRDCDRAAVRNLLFEQGDDGAVGAQDIAEADGHKLRFHVAEDIAGAVLVRALLADVGEDLGDFSGIAGFDLRVEGLDDHLAQALGGAHDVGGVDGLVCRDEDKALAAVHHGGVGRFVGADGVVLDGLAGAVLHEGDVLVRRGMVDDVGAVGFKDIEHAAAVTHGADEGDEVEIRVLLFQLELNGVGVVFVDIEDDEHFRPVGGHLPAELGADGSTAAGDEDALAVDEVKHLAQVRLDRLAAEEVFNGNVLHVTQCDLAGGQLIEAGELLDFAARLVADAEDLFSVLRGERGDGEVDLRDFILLHIGEDIFPAADDGHTFDGAAPFVGVIVYDADGLVVDFIRGFDIMDDHAAGLPCADDHDAAGGFIRGLAPGAYEEEEAVEKARDHDAHQLGNRAPEIIRNGHAAKKQRDEDDVQEGGRQ